MSASAIALNRFGLGAHPKDMLSPDSARSYLMAQIKAFTPKPLASIASSTQALNSVQAVREMVQVQRKKLRAGKDKPENATPENMTKVGDVVRPLYHSGLKARMESALTTRTDFAERLVHFWSNHFTVSGTKTQVLGLAAAYENDAIRPNIMGRFEDLLIAAVRHPAMLVYLDQDSSIGPNSPLAQRAAQRDNGKDRGLNENLAREILELHTLGVNGGYAQADVTELARAMTGITLAVGPRLKQMQKPGSPMQQLAGGAVYIAQLHEPGERRLLGARYTQSGLDQATAALTSLARHPATARFVATKLARHFVADTPPPALVTHLADVFTQSGGDLPSVYRALIERPESWATPLAKFKTPWEHVISGLRGVGTNNLDGEKAAGLFTQMGQAIFRAPSPAGWPDVAETWAAPDALFKRVEYASSLATRLGEQLDARLLADRILPGVLSNTTRLAIERAESGRQALALLLAAPEFLRR
jgi:uncharacterized protein (DUF1800 family)